MSGSKASVVAGCAWGCFDFKVSRTEGEAGSSGLTGSVAFRTPPLPFWESKSKAALVFPPNIRSENVRARFMSCLCEGAVFGRRFWRHLPSRTRLLMSPVAQVLRRRSRQAARSFGLDLRAGFWRTRIDITVMA